MIWHLASNISWLKTTDDYIADKYTLLKLSSLFYPCKVGKNRDPSIKNLLCPTQDRSE